VNVNSLRTTLDHTVISVNSMSYGGSNIISQKDEVRIAVFCHDRQTDRTRGILSMLRHKESDYGHICVF
jgi:hypothetical protein